MAPSSGQNQIVAFWPNMRKQQSRSRLLLVAKSSAGDFEGRCTSLRRSYDSHDPVLFCDELSPLLPSPLSGNKNKHKDEDLDEDILVTWFSGNLVNREERQEQRRHHDWWNGSSAFQSLLKNDERSEKNVLAVPEGEEQGFEREQPAIAAERVKVFDG